MYVVMDTSPTAPVTINFTGTQVGYDLSSVTFDNTNWSTPQTVTVNAIDDDIDEHPDTHPGNTSFSVVTTDPVYTAWPISDLPAAITAFKAMPEAGQQAGAAWLTQATGAAEALALIKAQTGAALQKFSQP